MKPILIILLLSVIGCTTPTPQKLNPAVYYKNDICFSYDMDVKKYGKVRTWFRNKHKRVFEQNKDNTKVIFCGVGVLPYQAEYKIHIDSFNRLNFFSMSTCHREVTTENPDKGLFKKNGFHKIHYRPTVEAGKACPMYVGAFNKKGRHGWGIVAFEHPRFTLEATIECNGDSIQFGGTSICQARYSLLQTITFDEEVLPVRPVNGPAGRKADCPVLATKDNKKFNFIMPGRECVYGFIGKTSRKKHKFYTVGYEQLIVRE